MHCKLRGFIAMPYPGFPCDKRYVDRRTGDRYALIWVGTGYRCYCNECYQTFRRTQEEGLNWIESEARIAR